MIARVLMRHFWQLPLYIYSLTLSSTLYAQEGVFSEEASSNVQAIETSVDGGDKGPLPLFWGGVEVRGGGVYALGDCPCYEVYLQVNVPAGVKTEKFIIDSRGLLGLQNRYNFNFGDTAASELTIGRVRVLRRLNEIVAMGAYTSGYSQWQDIDLSTTDGHRFDMQAMTHFEWFKWLHTDISFGLQYESSNVDFFPERDRRWTLPVRIAQSFVGKYFRLLPELTVDLPINDGDSLFDSDAIRVRGAGLMEVGLDIDTVGPTCVRLDIGAAVKGQLDPQLFEKWGIYGDYIAGAVYLKLGGFFDYNENGPCRD